VLQLLQLVSSSVKTLISFSNERLGEILGKQLRFGVSYPSPDGSMILIYAFTDEPNGRFYEAYIASLDLITLVPIKVDWTNYTEWVWSPDSTKLLSQVAFGNNRMIYVINSDGSELRKLVDATPYSWDPYWSFDGSEIYWSDYGVLRAINIDSLIIHRIGDGYNNLESLVFSPNGQKVAYFLFTKGKSSLYVANADFSNANMIFRLDRESYNPLAPSWSPDNQYILVNYYPCPEFIGHGCRSSKIEGAIVKADDGESVSLSVPEGNIKTLCGWAPDGKFVYIRKEDTGREYLELVDLSHLDSPESSVRISYQDLGCPIWLP